MPDMVQVGNEIIGGMLWPDGKLPDHWDNFADLLKAAIRGVEEGSGGDDKDDKGDSPFLLTQKSGQSPRSCPGS